MNVSKILIILLTFVTLSISCNIPVSKKEISSAKENILLFKSSYINNNLDTFYYKLPVEIEKNSDYEIDDNGNITLLVTKSIISCEKIFVGKDYIVNGLKYFRENCGKIQSESGVYELHTISIKKLNSNFFVPVWYWKNPIKVEDYGFGKYNLLLNLDASDFYKNGKIQSRLNLNFKSIDEECGYIQYTMSFVSTPKGWKLVSREQVNTLLNINNCERYFSDTILEKFVTTESEKWDFSNDFFIIKYTQNK